MKSGDDLYSVTTKRNSYKPKKEILFPDLSRCCVCNEETNLEPMLCSNLCLVRNSICSGNHVKCRHFLFQTCKTLLYCSMQKKTSLSFCCPSGEVGKLCPIGETARKCKFCFLRRFELEGKYSKMEGFQFC